MASHFRKTHLGSSDFSWICACPISSFCFWRSCPPGALSDVGCGHTCWWMDGLESIAWNWNMDWIRLGWCSLLSITYLYFLIWYCNLSLFCHSASWSAGKRSCWYLGWASGAKCRLGWVANSDEQGQQRICRVVYCCVVELGADLMCSCCSGAFGWRGWSFNYIHVLGYCWVDWATAGRTIQVAGSMLRHHCRISWMLRNCV